MTVVGSLLYLTIATVILFGGWAAAFYLGSAVFEPSLWRLLPAVLWPFLFRFAWLRFVPWFEPRDAVQRWLIVTKPTEDPGPT